MSEHADQNHQAKEKLKAHLQAKLFTPQFNMQVKESVAAFLQQELVVMTRNEKKHLFADVLHELVDEILAE